MPVPENMASNMILYDDNFVYTIIVMRILPLLRWKGEEDGCTTVPNRWWVRVGGACVRVRVGERVAGFKNWKLETSSCIYQVAGKK